MPGGFVSRFGVGVFLGFHQTLVILDRKFRIDRKPYDFLLILSSTRKLDRKLDPLSSIFGGHIGFILVAGEDLFEHRPQLNLSPRSARFHIREHLFEVTHADGQGLHFTQALIDLFQPTRLNASRGSLAASHPQWPSFDQAAWYCPPESP